MSLVIIFKVTNEFNKDPLVKTILKKFKQNYKFEHIIKNNYLITPDLFPLLDKSITDYSKKEYLLILLLTLYKYAVMKNYMKIVKVNMINDLTPEQKFKLNSIIEYLTGKEKTFKVDYNADFQTPKLSSVVREVSDVIDGILYNERVLGVSSELIDKCGHEHNPELVSIQILKTPLSKINYLFTVFKTTNYYTLRKNRVTKVFTLKGEELATNYGLLYDRILNFNNEVRRHPLLTKVMAYYIITGEMPELAEKYTPLDALVQNLAGVIGVKHSLYSHPTIISLSRYKSIKLNKDENPEFDTNMIKKYKDLLVQLILTNIELFKVLMKKLVGYKNQVNIFDPPIELIVEVLKDSMNNVVNLQYSKGYKVNVNLIWRDLMLSVNGRKMTVPKLIILEYSIDVKIKKDVLLKSFKELQNKEYWLNMKGHYAVYLNWDNKFKISTKYFNIDLSKYDGIIYTWNSDFQNKKWVIII